MKKIYIIFTAPKKPSILSYLVMFWQNTKYSHIALYFPAGQYLEVPVVAEADNTYVRLCSADRYFKDTKVVKTYKVALSDEARRKAFNVCMSYMGQKYPMLENLGIVLAKAFGLKKNPFSYGQKRCKCSEFVYYIFREIDPEFETSKDIDLLDVKDIDNLLEKYQYKHQDVITGLDKLS